MEAVSHSIRGSTPHVTDVEDNGYTFVVAFHDMASTVLRMKKGRKCRHLILSLQILIDVQCNDVPTAIAFATQPHLGLKPLETYPNLMISREIENWSESDYQSAPEDRYRLDDVKVFSNENEIKSAILANFRAGGCRYPLVGILKRNDFMDHRVATMAATERPYRFPENGPPADDEPGSESCHGVLIVGVDTTSEDPMMHFCEVKGSHGKRWGVKGFSKVGFEVFDCLLVPVLDD